MNFINKNTLSSKLFLDPFPHLVIDNFLHENHIPILLKEMDELTLDKSYYYGDQAIEKNKYAFKDNLGENLNLLFKELNGDEWIQYLEKSFNIEGVIRNNLRLQGAGVHKVLNEGFLCMHTDFEAYQDNTFGLIDRRLNLLLYMNPDWKEEYGGSLSFFDNNKQTIDKKISPILNRCVIFLTPGNMHGHPDILHLPEGMVRQSITTYYYTKNTTGKNLNGSEIIPVTWYFDIK